MCTEKFRKHGIQQDRKIVTEQYLIDLGINLAKDFPDQPIDDLRYYPVLSEGGWFVVIKDQKTLREIYRAPWRLLGPIELLSSSLNPD